MVPYKAFHLRGSSDYSQTATVNGDSVVVYLPEPPKGGGYGVGDWLATGTWEASGDGLSSGWRSYTKSMFAKVPKP